jgi:ribosomal protein L7/L12
MGDILGYLNLALLLLILASLETVRRQLDSVRQTLNAVSAQANPNASTVPPEVVGLLQAGRKIEAIKKYREATGAGLAEAKKAVEDLET